MLLLGRAGFLERDHVKACMCFIGAEEKGFESEVLETLRTFFLSVGYEGSFQDFKNKVLPADFKMPDTHDELLDALGFNS